MFSEQVLRIDAWVEAGGASSAQDKLRGSVEPSKYPPDERDEVYKEIFEQAENCKKYQGAK